MENDMTTMADEYVVAHQLISYKDVARTCSLSPISDFQRLERQLQRETLGRLRELGSSVRQLERLTGLGRGLIQRI